MVTREDLYNMIETASRTAKANAEALKVAQEEVYKHLFGEGGGVDPTPYLPAWEANRDTMTKVVVPEGVTKIGNVAFSGCSSLKALVIPEGVISIGKSAFSGCSSLTSLKTPSSVNSIGDSAFSNCSSLTSLELLEGVALIGNLAFSNCTGLTSLRIPEGVISIGLYAFRNCTGLTLLEIPSSVTSIKDNAFSGCLAKCYITFDKPSIDVSTMSYYPWGIASGAVIHCSDSEDLMVE